jgi:hypothetical protein
MRGKASSIGDTRVSLNGYHYTRTETGWQLTHRLVAEEKLGRPLRENERIRFVDNDRTNLDSDNIVVYVTKTKKEEPSWLRSDALSAER